MGLVSKFTVRSARWTVVWKTARWLLTEGRERLNRLSAAERRELADLMKKSRGRPSNLASAEKRRIADFVKKATVGSR